VPGIGPRTATAIKEAVAGQAANGKTGPAINMTTGEILED